MTAAKWPDNLQEDHHLLTFPRMLSDKYNKEQVDAPTFLEGQVDFFKAVFNNNLFCEVNIGL